MYHEFDSRNKALSICRGNNKEEIRIRRRKRVISKDEIQFNHKPAKMLLTEKRRESAKMAKPHVLLGSAHIVY